jgi:hypothetical protein
VNIIDKVNLQALMIGKVITGVDLDHGELKLFFADGTTFEREKTFEGEVIVTLFGNEREVIACSKI